MEDMNWINAIAFAQARHRGQKDLAGKPYINHLLAVVLAVETDHEKTVAALHDIVEDTDTTIVEIADRFGDAVAGDVECLTKRSGEAYADYILRVAKSSTAISVKLADLNHNMDVSRLPDKTCKEKKTIDRLTKYARASALLGSVRALREALP